MNQKIPKFHLIFISRLQVMHDNVCHWSHRVLYWINFHLRWFQLNSFGKMCFLERSSNKVWERLLYEITELAINFFFSIFAASNSILLSKQFKNSDSLRDKLQPKWICYTFNIRYGIQFPNLISFILLKLKQFVISFKKCACDLVSSAICPNLVPHLKIVGW